jgi:alpha-galactosidase
MSDPVRRPDTVYVLHDDAARPVQAQRDGDRFTTGAVEVVVCHGADGLAVRIACPGRGLSRVVLRWRQPAAELPDRADLLLGDAWERTYGDQQWRHRQPDRIMPWYWLAHDPRSGTTRAMGVRVRPSAFCAWLVDDEGVSVWLDVRNGGLPVRLGDRVLPAATVVAVSGGSDESPWRTHQRLCAAMCGDPRPDPGPVVGVNNWYYAYGRDFTPAHVLRDAQTIVELADGHPVTPFCVVDAGWSPGGDAPGGPWHRGTPGVFDDMPALARDIAAHGARAGIWLRPAALSTVDEPSRLRPGPHPVPEQPLDLTIADNLAGIAADIGRLRGWGFTLIKHDFSTFDAFGRFGSTMGIALTDPGWQLADRSVTNAEVLSRLYRTIRAAAGDALVLGCNTVGHLAAGLVDIQRVGDDTSGRHWERTRRMAVNALAYRLAQHRTFFTVDADCVPCTPATPWEKNRELLDLIANSGTALFVSIDPRSRNPRVDADLRSALRLALDGGMPGGVESLDWLYTTTPCRWRIGNEHRDYSWTDAPGSWPLVD